MISIKHFRVFIFVLCGVGFITSSLPAHADSRMAGSIPGKQQHSPPSAPSSDTDETDTIADYALLASYGLYKGPQRGGIRYDFWKGYTLEELNTAINEIPENTPYPVLQDLTRRMLLSATDGRNIKNNNSAHDAEDFLTGRMNKLLALGYFKEAAELYTQPGGQPYDEALAQSGVLAFLLSAQKELACIEVFSMADRFGDTPFWQEALTGCRYLILGKKPEDETKALSKTLSAIIEDEKYSRAVKKAPWDELSRLDRGWLLADGRLSYKGFKAERDAKAPAIRALLLQDDTLPPDSRAALIREEVTSGRRPPETLATYYESFAFKTVQTTATFPKEIKDWERLPYLYQALLKTEDEDRAARDSLLMQALKEKSDHRATALRPFAPYIKQINPQTLPSKKIKIRALRTLIEARESFPQEWREYARTFFTAEEQDSTLALLWILADIEGLITTEEDEEPVFTPLKPDTLSPHQQLIAKIIYEKLDRYGKLHNIALQNFKEPLDDLTSNEDYVMPSGDLIELLANAKKHQQCGAVVLSSVQLLKDQQAEKIDGFLLRTILDSYIAVGLEKEARLLAENALLGLLNK